MTTLLYLTPLPDAQTTQPPEQAARSQIRSAGLIPRAGVATERIALDGVDLTVSGQFRLGEFSKKLKRELNSLGESDYSSVAFSDDANPDADDQSGYYEVETVDVNAVHKTSDLAQQYRVGLTFTDTRESAWRAVKTNVNSISTGLATSGAPLIGVPTEATKTRWFDTRGASGSEVATVNSTENAEYGDVDTFNPNNASFDDPMLLYSLPYDREGPVDVRVWDDLGESKTVSYDDADGTTYTITQWVHAYHPSFEFEGVPVIDNGLIRLALDEPNNEINADEWNDGTSSWDDLANPGGQFEDYELFDADITTIGPAEVQVYAEWQDTGDDSIHATRISVQRGIDRAVVLQPANGTIPSDLETMLSNIASTQTEDAQPSQTVQSRGEVK